MVSDFHVNQDIILPTFFHHRHWKNRYMLEVRRAVAFYKSRTAEFRQSPRLFVCYGGPNRGKPGSPQRLASWIALTITLGKQRQGLHLNHHVKAHSTRGVLTSTAFARGASVSHICRAALRSSPSTFITHYRLDTQVRRDCAFGRAVLSAIL